MYIRVDSEFSDLEIVQIEKTFNSFLLIENCNKHIYPIDIYYVNISHKVLVNLGFQKLTMHGLIFFRRHLYLIRYFNDNYELLLGKGLSIKVNYVHKLQNLWYELTDEELIYNEKIIQLPLKINKQ